MYRSHIVFFLKHPVEIFDILITYGIGNLFYGHVAVFQQGFCLFHADVLHQFYKGLSRFVLDIFGNIGLGQVELLGKIFQGHGLVVGLNVVLHGGQPFVLYMFLCLDFGELVHSDYQCINGCLDDIVVDADTPVHFLLMGNAHICHGLRGRTVGQRVLLIDRQFIADIKVLLDNIADSIQASVAVCVHICRAFALRNRRFCYDTVHLFKMTLRNIEIWVIVHIFIGENVINPLRR